MSNPHFLYLPLILAMALQLFACITFIGPARSHRRIFTPYTFYLLLLSCGVMGTVLMNLPCWTGIALFLRFFSRITVFGRKSLVFAEKAVPRQLKATPHN